MLRRPAAKGAAKAAPKVKAAAKGAAKRAAAPALRRPAARVRDLRSSEDKFRAGEEVQIGSLPLDAFKKGDWVASSDSLYYGGDCVWAGKIGRAVLEDGIAELEVVLTGTESETLLQAATSRAPGSVTRIHCCKADCDKKRENPDLIHCNKIYLVDTSVEAGWEKNLEVADEAAELRRRQEAWNKQKEDEEKPKKPRSSSSEKDKKKKKKKKKKDKEDSESGGKEKKKKRKYGGRTLAKKDVALIFEGTGMDPDPGIRKKLGKKLKRQLKKNKSVSSGSSGDSSTSSGLDEEVLDDRSKLHKIAALAPGVLTAASLKNMKLYVTQASGSQWSADEDSLPALMVAYTRQHLAHRGSGGLLREAVSLSHIGDLIIQGRIAEAVDCLSQRLKCVELMLAGHPYAVAQKVEIMPGMEPLISSRTEMQLAQKEAKMDYAVKVPAYTPERPKGQAKGKDKGKKGDKGKGKAKDEGRKGGGDKNS